MANWEYQGLAFQNDGRVGVPRFVAGLPEPLNDPPEGVMSVLFAVSPATQGTFGPTPSPDDRLQQAGLKP